MSTISRQDASKRIAKHLAEANAALEAAIEIARESGTGFTWTGPSSGMGGYYTPPGPDAENWNNDDNDNGWSTSSQNC